MREKYPFVGNQELKHRFKQIWDLRMVKLLLDIKGSKHLPLWKLVKRFRELYPNEKHYFQVRNCCVYRREISEHYFSILLYRYRKGALK